MAHEKGEQDQVVKIDIKGIGCPSSAETDTLVIEIVVDHFPNWDGQEGELACKRKVSVM